MSGLCGWLQARDEVTDRDLLLEKMTGHVSRYDKSTVKCATGPNWGLATAALGGSGAFGHEDGRIAAICGTPRVVDKKIEESSRQLGLANALAIAYERRGVEILKHLRGSFSLAIILQTKSQVLLAADRVGINPLYYADSDGDLVFSSTPAAINEFPAMQPEIDWQALYHYFYFHMIPSPCAIYKDMRRLQPATYVEIKDAKMTSAPYWETRYTNERARLSVSDLKGEFMELLRESVAEQVEDGQNVGCFLSGGTDSSTVAGMLGKVTDGSARSYSIGFDQSGYDEMEFARIAAKHFNMDHHEYYVTPRDIVTAVPHIAEIYGQPFGNSSVVPTYYCARLAKDDGVDRILGGDGGDELFGGNERYATQKLLGYYHHIPQPLRRYLIEPLVFSFPFGDRVFPIRKARRYIDKALTKMPDRLQSYNYLDWFDIDDLFAPDFINSVDTSLPIGHLREVYEGAKADTMVNRMAALDFKITLADTDLRKVSSMCELAGVQIGYPLLSDPLVEFAARLPIAHKLRGLKLRFFFKEALRDFLPTEIITKRKQGFGLPFGHWAVSNPELRQLVNDSLGDLKARGIVRPEFIDQLITQRLPEQPGYFGEMVWILLMLEHWFKRHHDARSN